MPGSLSLNNESNILNKNCVITDTPTPWPTPQTKLRHWQTKIRVKPHNFEDLQIKTFFQTIWDCQSVKMMKKTAVSRIILN